MSEQNKDLLGWAAGIGLFFAAGYVAQRLNEYDVKGKTVLITGGSRGLGLVLGRELAREGAKLAICARDTEELDRARDDLVSHGADVLALPCDVTDRAQVEATVKAVLDRYGRIDVLFNNAGVIQVGPMEEMTLHDYEEAMATHFWAPLYMTLAALPDMRRRKEGRIVNISSIGGKIPMPHMLPYTASKFALTGLSEGLRAELAKDGIVVTTICPGLIRTGSDQQGFFKGRNEKEHAWFSLLMGVPLTSISAEHAARQILAAMKRGKAEVVLTFPARAAATFHALFPGATADLMAKVNRALPEPGGIGAERATGMESDSERSPSWATALNEKAARDNNQWIQAGE